MDKNKKCKEIKKINVGGNLFFSKLDGYIFHDDDVVYILDNFPSTDANVLILKRKKSDAFLLRNMSKEDAINDVLNSGEYLRAGKFLNPEYLEWLNMSVDELPLLSKAFNNLDERHSYEKVIYEAYLENGSPTLTDEQRKHAFEVYKSARKKAYK